MQTTHQQHALQRKTIVICLLVILSFILGCSSLNRAWSQTGPAPAVSSTRLPPVDGKPTAPSSAAAQIQPRLWFDASVPDALRANVSLPASVELAASGADANLTVSVVDQGTTGWVYALVAPFPTLLDEVSLVNLQQAWQKGRSDGTVAVPLRMENSTREAFTHLWGAPGANAVEVMAGDALLNAAWAELPQPFLAIVPFERLDPRWKVLRIDGMSPYDRGLDLANYPLVVPFGIQGSPEAIAALNQNTSGVMLLPNGNRDETRLTILVMTGVTALVRSTGAKMEANGMTYPARDIGGWLRSADVTHISNEIAFSPHCPPANPYQDTLQFCSRPEYIELLEDVGADIIDMTGNHMLDWNLDSLLYTLGMYRERGWKFYASGETLEEAQKAIIVEDHGNRLAFMGCNPVGPEHAWATEFRGGIAPCDYEFMHAEISRLHSEGYLPIVTFQYHEYYSPEARPWQTEDFGGMAKAGAVIVSGSQAHVPQAMTFVDDRFIHFGLGNLFFDQMDIPVVGTRREFIDRHVFYAGRYLGTELLTAMLEDYSRPRPMTAEERESLLTDIFSASDWSGVFRKDGE